MAEMAIRQAAIDLQDRVAIVAGACGGIGQAVAERLAQSGAKLALWDLNGAGLDALCSRLPGAVSITADLTDEASVAAAMERTLAHFGRVEILVHSVGVTGPCMPVHEYALNDWTRTLDINLTSAFLCSRVVVKPMLDAGYGRIVHLASIAGKEGNADMSAYSVAKAGVIALTKSMGKELALTPVRVNCIAPAVIETTLTQQMTEQALNTSLSKIPMRRTGKPSEVAAMVAWLASEESSFSTGACFDLSGGRATQRVSMHVLVTGGAGFLGAWVVRTLLEMGHTVRVFDTRHEPRLLREIVGPAAESLEWHIGDIGDENSVFAAAVGCDTVIHLAGVLTPQCRDNPLLGARINLLGTINIFEAARRQGWRQLAYASSAGVFGPDDAVNPLPATLYGTYKLACEGVARAYCVDAGDAAPIASVGLRPLVVYGPGREGGLSAGPSLACRAAARGEPYVMPFSGETGFVYVEDAARAFAIAACQPLEGAHVFNMMGEVAGIQDFIDEVVRQRPDAQLGIEGPPLPIRPAIDNPDLQAILPGATRTPLAEGIARTLAYYAQ